jgi:hypothetical protein
MIRLPDYDYKDGKLVKRKRNKYGAQKVTTEGTEFDSLFESQVYQERLLQEQAGEISGLELQKTFVLQEAFRDRAGNWHRAITWRADFTYVENGVKTAEDAKGFENPVWRLKRKLFARHYPEWILKVTKK